jgi:hypothetical protein
MTVKGLRLVEIRQSSEAPAIADVSLAVREQVRKLLRRRNLPPPGVSAAERACRCGWHLSMLHVSQVMRREVSGGNSGVRFSAKAARPIL